MHPIEFPLPIDARQQQERRKTDPQDISGYGSQDNHARQNEGREKAEKVTLGDVAEEVSHSPNFFILL